MNRLGFLIIYIYIYLYVLIGRITRLMSMQYVFDPLDNDFSSGSMGVSKKFWPHPVQTPDDRTLYREPFWETRETFV